MCRRCERETWCKESHKNYRAKQKAAAWRPYVLIYQKELVCASCGFEAQHPSQMDIDHIDGNKGNTCLTNFQTLCANCHRLKTHMNRDYLNKIYR